MTEQIRRTESWPDSATSAEELLVVAIEAAREAGAILEAEKGTGRSGPAGSLFHAVPLVG